MKKKDKKEEAQNPETTESKEKDSGIVIEETEADVELGTEFVGDTEDLKKAVKRDSEKGKLARILLPLLVFALIGGVIGYATWYYTRPERTEGTKSAEEKIQTPPVIEEGATEEKVVEKESAEEEVVEEESSSTESEKEYTTYTVKSGDTLSGIANQYDMTSSELADYNNITDVHTLQIGQTIKIPQ